VLSRHRLRAAHVDIVDDIGLLTHYVALEAKKVPNSAFES